MYNYVIFITLLYFLTPFFYFDFHKKWFTLGEVEVISGIIR